MALGRRRTTGGKEQTVSIPETSTWDNIKLLPGISLEVDYRVKGAYIPHTYSR